MRPSTPRGIPIRYIHRHHRTQKANSYTYTHTPLARADYLYSPYGIAYTYLNPSRSQGRFSGNKVPVAVQSNGRHTGHAARACATPLSATSLRVPHTLSREKASREVLLDSHVQPPAHLSPWWPVEPALRIKALVGLVAVERRMHCATLARDCEQFEDHRLS